MPASSNHPAPARPRLEGDHWTELMATLSNESTEILGSWIDNELAKMQRKLDSFVSPNSLHKSLSRSR